MAFGVADFADAQGVVQFPGGQGEWFGCGAVAWVRQGVCGGGAAVEGDVAVGFGKQLVHMAVEAGHRGEAAQVTQGLGGVVGAPAPVRVHGEQRDVAEHNDRGVSGQRGDVFFDELKLIGSQMAQLGHVQGVHQRDDVHAGGVEAVPAVAPGACAERLAVLLAAVIDGIVFPGHGEDVRGVEPGQHLLDLVELVGGGQMRQVAGVDDEIRCVAETVDLVDRLGERTGHVGVGAAGEADVAVADLSETQRRPGDLRRVGGPG